LDAFIKVVPKCSRDADVVTTHERAVRNGSAEEVGTGYKMEVDYDSRDRKVSLWRWKLVPEDLVEKQ